jgi:protein PhnA
MPNKCPQCASEHGYQDRNFWICPECGHEWDPSSNPQTATDAAFTVRDAYGQVLADGDSVTVVKDLKVKGSSSVVKIGTKVKSIRLIEGVDDHNIACKIDGFGSMNLKSEFVKKS